jgi:hypothetical protein
MGKILGLIIILILEFNHLSGQDFIGYRNDNGIFFYENKNMFVDFDNNQIKGIEHKQGLKPLFINDKSIIYLNKESNKLKIFSDSTTYTISLKKRPYFITANSSSEMIVLSDEDFRLKILNVHTDRIQSIEGFAPIFINNQLYFSNYLDDETSTDILVNIFKADIDSCNNIKNVHKVASDIVEEGWYITQDQKYIIGSKLIEGNLKDIIFTISSKKFSVLDTDLLSSGYRPFYSIKDKSLYFYSSKDRKNITLPK